MTFDWIDLLLVLIGGMFLGGLLAVIGVYQGLASGRRGIRGFTITKDEQ